MPGLALRVTYITIKLVKRNLIESNICPFKKYQLHLEVPTDCEYNTKASKI